MKLLLTNFKCYTNKTFDLPPTGLVLLHGDSGVGKSTIFKAIFWCLYGELNKKSFGTVTTYGEKKTCVIIQDNGICITRKTSPNALYVIYNSKNYESEEAQSIINNIYGDNFLLTSYITQKQINSFLKLTSSEQMEYLEKLALNDGKHEVIKEKVKNYKSNLKKQIELAESELYTINTFQKIKPSIPSKLYSIKKIDSFKIKVESIYKKLKILNTKLNELKIQNINNLNNINKNNEYNIIISKLQTEINDLKNIKNVDVNYLKSLKDQLQYINDNKSIVQYENDYNKYISQYNKYKEENDLKLIDIKTQLLSLTNIEEIRLNISLKEKLNSLTVERGNVNVDYLLKSITELETSINTKSYKCPHCNNCVEIKENILIKSNVEPSNVDVKILKSKLKKLNEEYVKTSNIDKKICEIKSKITLTTNLEELLQKVKLNDNLQYELTQLQTEPKHLIEEKNRLNNLKSKLPQIKKIKLTKSESELISEISTLQLLEKQYIRDNERLNKLNEELKEYTDKICVVKDYDFAKEINSIELKVKKYNNKLKKLNSKQSDIQLSIDYNNKLIEYNEFNDKYTSKRNTLDMLRTRMENTDILLREINESEMCTISSKLNIINFHLKYYLSNFFTDSISVNIVPYKELQNKSIKPIISLQIIHKGNTIGIEDLSGGEEDRLTLCIFLALNELNHSKMLFLDESIASLQSPLSNKIIECLRDNIAKTKLIMTINHNAEVGMFNSVIEISG